jgi:cytochrome c oxidase assembly factor CtaG
VTAVAALLACAALLVVAARRHRRWPRARTAAGLGGLAALALAFAAPLDDRASVLLSAHMLQHALVALVAAPLLVAAAPLRLALGALPRAQARRLARALRGRRLRALAHPATGLAVFVVVLAVVHLPAVYEAALRHPLAHGAEHAALLWAAIGLWALPRRSGVLARVSVLVAAMTAMAALGAVLAAARGVVYPWYATRSADPLADQALAGAIMWIGGMLVVLPALLALAWAALAREERRQRAREALGAGR